MHPVTPAEKVRAFERIRGCANSLLHDQAITYGEFKILVDRAVTLHGDCVKQLEAECTRDQKNGERST